MTDQQPPKKVVKRVVKKAVAPPPAMRYGRPTAAPQPSTIPPPPADDPRSTAPTAVADRIELAPSPSVTTDTIEVRQTGFKRPRLKRPELKRPQMNAPKVTAPQIDLAPIRERAARTASNVASTTRSVARTSSDFVVDRWYDLRAWWLPSVEPLRASALTGLLVGLLAVALGIGALAIFSQVRGVASGGGTWGSLTFVVVAFVAFAAGERLLAGFGAPMPRLTSFLGLTLTLVAILGLFLGIADSTLGIVVVPLVSAVGFLAAHWLLALAELTPAEPE